MAIKVSNKVVITNTADLKAKKGDFSSNVDIKGKDVLTPIFTSQCHCCNQR